MFGVSIRPPNGSIAAKPTSSHTMKSTLGEPFLALGSIYGSQSGVEFLISWSMMPLNGLDKYDHPLNDSLAVARSVNQSAYWITAHDSFELGVLKDGEFANKWMRVPAVRGADLKVEDDTIISWAFYDE